MTLSVEKEELARHVAARRAECMFRVMLDQRPSNQYPVIQLMNLQSACMTWTYTAMRDQKHEAHVFGSSSSSNYGNLVLKAQFESIKEA
ncbi:hypothetical protein V6N12_006911 [Hibiscus sabdariffa]|uniref:Uncharacterized protein n=1 Tax=Hibiscus sabdariffa TaxID=183260 RepID=A0ABR2F0A5_9ROSI